MNITSPTPNANKPKLTWYEQLWLGWPMILIFIGGAIGGACGGAAWGLNQQVFQNTKNPVLRYVFTGFISIAAFVVYFVVASLFISRFRPPQ